MKNECININIDIEKKMDKTTGFNFMNKNVLLSIHSIHVKKSKLLQILSSDQSTY